MSALRSLNPDGTVRLIDEGPHAWEPLPGWRPRGGPIRTLSDADERKILQRQKDALRSEKRKAERKAARG